MPFLEATTLEERGRGGESRRCAAPSSHAGWALGGRGGREGCGCGLRPTPARQREGTRADGAEPVLVHTARALCTLCAVPARLRPPPHCGDASRLARGPRKTAGHCFFYFACTGEGGAAGSTRTIAMMISIPYVAYGYLTRFEEEYLFCRTPAPLGAQARPKERPTSGGGRHQRAEREAAVAHDFSSSPFPDTARPGNGWLGAACGAHRSKKRFLCLWCQYRCCLYTPTTIAHVSSQRLNTRFLCPVSRPLLQIKIASRLYSICAHLSSRPSHAKAWPVCTMSGASPRSSLLGAVGSNRALLLCGGAVVGAASLYWLFFSSPSSPAAPPPPPGGPRSEPLVRFTVAPVLKGETVTVYPVRAGVGVGFRVWVRLR